MSSCETVALHMVTIEEVLALLDQLNQLRKKTRYLARHQLKPDAVRGFIDQFQRIEDQVIEEIATKLRGWYIDTQLDIDRLAYRIEELEREISSQTPLLEVGQLLTT